MGHVMLAKMLSCVFQERQLPSIRLSRADTVHWISRVGALDITCRHFGFHMQALWISRAGTLDFTCRHCALDFTCRHFGFHVQALCLYADVDSHLSISCLIVENSLVEHSAFDLDSAKQSMAKQSGACFKHRL